MAVQGSVDARFDPVAEVFADVIEAGAGTGSALAVWYDGAWVVDIWGGYVDVGRSRAWQAGSIVMPYSVTKPFAAMCALALVDRGAIDLETPVRTLWPELRADTTVREVLAHQSGLVVLDRAAPEEAFYDWDLMCTLLAEQEPSWAPGSAHGESALFYGHLVGEVVRRVDGRTLGQFLAQEVCGPAGLEFAVGLEDGQLDRVVDLTGFDEHFRRRGSDGRSDLFVRALNNPPGALDPAVVNGERWRRAEIPAVNGHGTARAVAGLYAALHEGRLLSPDLRTEMTRPTAIGMDQVLGVEQTWGLGVAVDADGFGMGGVGGSFGWWSEVGGYAIGFVTGEVADHDRGERLENVVRDCVGLPAL